MTFTSDDSVRGLRMAIVGLGLVLMPAFGHGREQAQEATVSVRVEGEPRTAASMQERLRKRGARHGIAVTADGTSYQLRILVLVRGPQWHQVFGVSASGAVAVLDARGELLWMHLRQKEATTSGAMDDMADEILRRLPALLRGEKMLTAAFSAGPPPHAAGGGGRTVVNASAEVSECSESRPSVQF